MIKLLIYLLFYLFYILKIMSDKTRMWVAIAILITFVNYILAESNNLIYSGKPKTLVLLDDWHYLDTHSLFWDQLKSTFLKLVKMLS